MNGKGEGIGGATCKVPIWVISALSDDGTTLTVTYIQSNNMAS